MDIFTTCPCTFNSFLPQSVDCSWRFSSVDADLRCCGLRKGHRGRYRSKTSNMASGIKSHTGNLDRPASPLGGPCVINSCRCVFLLGTSKGTSGSPWSSKYLYNSRNQKANQYRSHYIHIPTVWSLLECPEDCLVKKLWQAYDPPGQFRTSNLCCIL